jgi:tripartite-type tricarboxylate transporter receptor subunit TctC
VKSPDVQERLRGFGLQPTGTSAAEFVAIVKADSDRWAPAVKASGFTPQQ